LFWTIAGLFMLTAIVGTAAQALVAIAVLRPLEAREARTRGELAASGVASAIAASVEPPRGAELDSLLEHERDLAGFRPGLLMYWSADGTVSSAPPGSIRLLMRELGDSSATATLDPDSVRSRLARAPATSDARARGRFDLMARRTVVRGATRLGEVLALRRMPTRIPGSLDSRAMLMFLPVAIAVSMVAGLFVVRMLVARLRAMELLAARVAEGDLTVRISDVSGDEIGQLAARLDRMTERLAEARTQLETTEQQRRQLFADITHELATPLTSIRGYAETMLDPGVPISSEERVQYVRGMLDESSRMNRLIRDLFELARLEAGAVPLARERLDWAALCRFAVERLEPRFRKSGLRLEWRDSVPEAWIEADGHRLEQVIDNLLVNALRYVPEGGTVEIALGAAPTPNRFRLTVRDDGPGVPEEELPQLFERFFRGSGSRGDGAEGGSGLGLAIVREIVERHGGQVRAEARAPHGLAIIVELPARPHSGA
jgi:signal transduction histidine kinase